MSLGLHDRQARARRRLIWGIVRWVIALAVIGLAGLYAYKTGSSLAALDVARLETQVADLKKTIQTLRTENATLKATAATAERRAKQWEQRYRAEVPTGDAKALLDLAKSKLSEGVGADRLAFVIGATAANPRTCDADPESKRFFVRTPTGRANRDSSTSFADRRITVIAEGQPELDSEGRQEAWFDPGQPVTVRFTDLGGKTTEATGVLPLQHSMVIGDSEFRFSVAADDKRGFAVATAQRCDFP